MRSSLLPLHFVSAWAATTAAPKLKVLCLHGYSQNGEPHDATLLLLHLHRLLHLHHRHPPPPPPSTSTIFTTSSTSTTYTFTLRQFASGAGTVIVDGDNVRGKSG